MTPRTLTLRRASLSRPWGFADSRCGRRLKTRTICFSTLFVPLLASIRGLSWSAAEERASYFLPGLCASTNDSLSPTTVSLYKSIIYIDIILLELASATNDGYRHSLAIFQKLYTLLSRNTSELSSPLTNRKALTRRWKGYSFCDYMRPCKQGKISVSMQLSNL